ncbi:IclR family transcriptional regulator [Paraburkholderia sp. GAS42]|jgi:DNA-binding IclR family transcriptional regulator|uniref:IclR family transcriptional regulator n=1 Tax=Paraburkholderia sp. GAS42 TaxID=3035135 RepID=UPI003D23796A
MRVVKGAVDRSLQIIELLACEAGWIRMPDFGAELEFENGLPRRVPGQPREQGWAGQDKHTSRYRLTLKLSVLGQRYLRGLGLPALVQPILDAVAAQCRELVRLIVVWDSTFGWLASSQGEAPGLMYSPSMDSPITVHATVNGKVWLPSMSNDRALECALRGGLGKAVASLCGPRAITGIEQLIPELDLTRQRGYGLVVEEAEPGVAALAVPVRSLTDGTVVGTMSAAGPVMRVRPERYDDFYALLKEGASKLDAVWPRESAGGNVSEAA